MQNDDTAWNLYSDKYNVGAVFMFSWGKKNMTAQTTERQKNEMFSVVEIAGVSGGSK